MATVLVNGAQLYYEVFGAEHHAAVPILLIHGATATGRSDWGEVAPLLARSHTVIVPDCRGHGQSTNPHGSYAFAELARDCAALVRVLGYRRAHVFGHSNGGNVALVMLLEQPDVVQSCVVQAANAYVSPDLRVREPVVLDPDRIEREAPGWKQEMIALHGPTHGPDYWRDLLRMTLAEILAAPNYTPADLVRVTRPTLVIQGEQDPVNAPARHAQFIARHVPHAELWVPPAAGHSVHRERPCVWLERVLDFLARRGDDANEALYRLRRARYADERAAIFDVKAEDEGRSVAGQVLTEEQHQAMLAVLPEQPIEDQVRVLLAPGTPWALVNRNVTDLRRGPSRSSELVSQALLGEAARVLEERAEWARLRLIDDEYMGWVQVGALYRCSEAGALAYRAACDVVVQAQLAPAYAAPEVAERLPAVPAFPLGSLAGVLPFGVRLPLVTATDEWEAVRLPDGRVWRVSPGDLRPAISSPALSVTEALALIRRSVGVPYLWGGRSPFGYDCSGLAQAFLRFLGIPAPRDADQQFRAGQAVGGEPQPGDLLFFGDDEEAGSSSGRFARITHVAISLGSGYFIHANGAASCVSYNSFDASSPLYRAWLREHLAGARRFW